MMSWERQRKMRPALTSELETLLGGTGERCVWEELMAGALAWASGGGAEGIPPVKGLGAGAELDPPQQSFFHLKLPRASTSLGYGGSLRWTTWSSRSTISSPKIRRTEMLDIGPDTGQNWFFTHEYFLQESKSFSCNWREDIILTRAEESKKKKITKY